MDCSVDICLRDQRQSANFVWLISLIAQVVLRVISRAGFEQCTVTAFPSCLSLSVLKAGNDVCMCCVLLRQAVHS
jgi:hypothetical protein